MERLAQHIESLIFSTDQPVTLQEIKSCLEEVLEANFAEEELLEAIGQLKERYEQDGYAFAINEIAEGYQFLTKPAFHNTVGAYLRQTTRKRLSRAALETLSIIAYKQPVTKTEMERIRGVSCDYSIQKLLEKELVAIVGRDEGPGRPLLYGTSDKFMDYFGLKSLRDLPKPKEFKESDFMIGEQAPIEEDVPEGSDDQLSEEE
ncbi:MAG: SMC-Scp complex subunit ScpB [Lewinellaceae bacterium]|nr:SMC-Scp complex subunit ScpB [Phaeodactylibacter sp.]MCB9039651.1 SMC-Scp complex subunit ScpB [Lewinellaceae bacterium]